MEKYTMKSLMKEHAVTHEDAEMTPEILCDIINESVNSEILDQKPGYVLFKYFGKNMVLLFDQKYDRMRLLAAVTNYSTLDLKTKETLMQANFHSALDARYAVSDDILYTAFIHPLSTLTPLDFESALHQVFHLAKNFGSSYSSGKLRFSKDGNKS